MKQKRRKSKALWLSAAALIGFISKTYFNFEIPEFDILVDMILMLAIGFGIINDPTNKDAI